MRAFAVVALIFMPLHLMADEASGVDTTALERCIAEVERLHVMAEAFSRLEFNGKAVAASDVEHLIGALRTETWLFAAEVAVSEPSENLLSNEEADQAALSKDDFYDAYVRYRTFEEATSKLYRGLAEAIIKKTSDLAEIKAKLVSRCMEPASQKIWAPLVGIWTDTQ
jgi:hypothetical protein